MTATRTPPRLRSVVEGSEWPAVPDRAAADLIVQLYQLEQSEWLAPKALRELQDGQLAWLMTYAQEHSEFYRTRFSKIGLAQANLRDAAVFSRLPLLTRTELRTHAARIRCHRVPPSHGKVGVVHTSGATGQPVSLERTGLNQLMWAALTMRDHLWHERDFSGSLAAIRAHVPLLNDEAKARAQGWGPPATLLYATGPSFTLPLSTDLERQADWLEEHNPSYLLTYPTNLAGLVRTLERRGRKLPALREVRTIGETLSETLRVRCRTALDVEIADSYSSQEVGAIALQCPVSKLYHLQSESLLVEVLDAAGSPVREGEVGRVVVTDLHNFAMPLIRYELRDYAEVGSACPCGRGLPTLRRILGRQRNMVVLPDGTRHWPLVGFHEYPSIANILQYQFVQHSVDEIEMRVHTEQARLSSAQESRLAAVVQRSLGHPFRIRFTHSDTALPQSEGGKFEEFISLVE